MAANGGRGLRKPVFVKVESLKPGTTGHTLVVKVLNSNTVLQKGAAASPHLRGTSIAECLVGDETASILFTARNEQEVLNERIYLPYPQNAFTIVVKGDRSPYGLGVPFTFNNYSICSRIVDLMKPGNTVNLRNAKIDMFKGSMRLAVDKWGRVEVTEPATFVVKEDNNLSLVEYELVNVA